MAVFLCFMLFFISREIRMTRGKPLVCPKITVSHSSNPKFSSRDELWTVAGPILARIMTQVLVRELSISSSSKKKVPNQNS
jgi:hypothetical protein